MIETDQRSAEQRTLVNPIRMALGLLLSAAAAVGNVLWLSLQEFGRHPAFAGEGGFGDPGGRRLDSIIGAPGILAIQLCGLLGGVLLVEATWRSCTEAGERRVGSRTRTGIILCGSALGCLLAGVIPALIGNGLVPSDAGLEGLLPLIAGMLAGILALLLAVPGGLCLRSRGESEGAEPRGVDPAVVAGVIVLTVAAFLVLRLIAPS